MYDVCCTIPMFTGAVIQASCWAEHLGKKGEGRRREKAKGGAGWEFQPLSGEAQRWSEWNGHRNRRFRGDRMIISLPLHVKGLCRVSLAIVQRKLPDAFPFTPAHSSTDIPRVELFLAIPQGSRSGRFQFFDKSHSLWLLSRWLPLPSLEDSYQGLEPDSKLLTRLWVNCK